MADLRQEVDLTLLANERLFAISTSTEYNARGHDQYPHAQPRYQINSLEPPTVDPKISSSAPFQYRSTDRCGNCESLGHSLAVCPKPTPGYGYLIGCPLCNVRTHTLDTCNKAQHLPKDVWFCFLVLLRRRRPPLLCSRKWWDILPRWYSGPFPHSGIFKHGITIDALTQSRPNVKRNIVAFNAGWQNAMDDLLAAVGDTAEGDRAVKESTQDNRKGQLGEHKEAKLRGHEANAPIEKSEWKKKPERLFKHYKPYLTQERGGMAQREREDSGRACQPGLADEILWAQSHYRPASRHESWMESQSRSRDDSRREHPREHRPSSREYPREYRSRSRDHPREHRSRSREHPRKYRSRSRQHPREYKSRSREDSRERRLRDLGDSWQPGSRYD